MRPALWSSSDSLQLPLLLLLLLLLTGGTAGETALLDPQFNSIATCPCDLTSNACDIACCCDTDCSDADKTLFDCPVGVFYGNDNTVSLRSCESTSRFNPDYHQFTCVLIENFNAYLGLYFPVTAALTTQAAVQSKTVSDIFQFRENLGPFALSEANAATQRKGLIVLQQQTNVDAYSGGSSLSANMRLALPSRTLAGSCDTSAGVIFLADNSSSGCDRVVTEVLCLPNVSSPFDYLNYACDNCKISINRGSASINISVDFRQLSSAFGYQKGLSASVPTALTATPQQPLIVGSICTNAVVGVEYLLRWNQSNVTSISATILVANVSIGSTVTQRFAANFLHASSPEVVVKRSGRVGYEPGASVLFLRNNGTGNVTSDTLPLLTPNSNGECQAGTGDSIGFLVNSARYCRQLLQLQNFTDCAGLRNSMANVLSSQFNADKVGVYGAANASVNGDWATLLKPNPTEFSVSSAVWETSKGYCSSVPTDITLTLLYAEQGKANDSSIWHIVGASYAYSVANLSFTCSFGSCSGTTAVSMATQVRFVRVSPTWKSSSGSSIGTYKAPCWWGICWDEFAYPLTEDFDAEPKARSLAWALMLLAILIYSCCVSYPWW